MSAGKGKRANDYTAALERLGAAAASHAASREQTAGLKSARGAAQWAVVTTAHAEGLSPLLVSEDLRQYDKSIRTKARRVLEAAVNGTTDNGTPFSLSSFDSLGAAYAAVVAPAPQAAPQAEQAAEEVAPQAVVVDQDAVVQWIAGEVATADNPAGRWADLLDLFMQVGAAARDAAVSARTGEVFGDE